MRKQLLTAASALTLSVWAAGCATDTTTNTNTGVTTNANTANTAAPRTAPDDSEIVTSEQNGNKVETRTFRNNPRISRVVVTTEPSGRRTARVYTRDNQERELPEGKVETALEATGDAIVAGAGFVADKGEDVGGAVVDGAKTVGREAGDKLEDAGGAAVDGAKTVGREAGDKLEDAGGAVKKGAKKAGSATVKGAKKAGSAIKDAVTP